MKLKILTLLFLSIINHTYSQIKVNRSNVWTAKEFSKEISQFKAKEFLITSVLESSTDVIPFEIIPLAASSSGELTTLIYNCETQQKEGLILGFYGDYWNENGTLYQGYAFKNMDKEKAIEFMNKIEQSIDTNSDYLYDKPENNNIFFVYDDIDVLISYTFNGSYEIRLFWEGFDSTWEKTAFERSKKRFEKKSK